MQKKPTKMDRNRIDKVQNETSNLKLLNRILIKIALVEAQYMYLKM